MRRSAGAHYYRNLNPGYHGCEHSTPSLSYSLYSKICKHTPCCILRFRQLLLFFFITISAVALDPGPPRPVYKAV